MALTRKLKLFLTLLGAMIVLVVLGVWLLWSRIEMYAAGYHQRAVTHELRDWAAEYALVTNASSAVAAAEMGEYMSRYYGPGPGYRGAPEIEAALERRRRDSIQRIVDALQRYSGLDYGTNAPLWGEWAESRKKDLDRAGNSEPGGAANRGQPVGSETNRTSAAAGPGG